MRDKQNGPRHTGQTEGASAEADLAALSPVHGYNVEVAGKDVYVVLDDLKDVAQPGRTDVIIDHARGQLGPDKPIIVAVGNSQYHFQHYPDLGDKLLAALELSKSGKSSDALVYDRGNVDREWTYYTTIELHPGKNAIVVRQAHPDDVLTKGSEQLKTQASSGALSLRDGDMIVCQKAELSNSVGPVSERHGCAFDDVGMFPRYTIGENKDVYAFKVVKS